MARKCGPRDPVCQRSFADMDPIPSMRGIDTVISEHVQNCQGGIFGKLSDEATIDATKTYKN